MSSYKFTSGSNTATKPGTTYGSLSATTTWSMTAGNGFSLSNYTVTAEGRGTTTGATRNSNTITETAKCWWIPTSSYNAAGTISGQTTDTDYCVQEANAKETQFGDVNVTSPKNSIGQIGAGGGSQTPTLSAWQACWSGYTSGSGSNSWTNTTFTWTFNKSANAGLGTGFYFKNASTGQISATSRGTTIGSVTTSNTVTAYAYANGATGNSSYYATQAANSSSVTWGNLSTFSVEYDNDIPASGGTTTPSNIDPPTQSGTVSYTSGSSAATSNTSFSYSYAMTASGRWSLKNSSTGQISAGTRGNTIGTFETSPTITVTATGAGSKTKNTTTTAQQDENTVTSTTWNNPSISVPAAGKVGTNISAGGGQMGYTDSSDFSATQSGTAYLKSGGSTSTANTSFTWSSNKTAGASLGTGFYYKSDFVISAANRTTTTGSSRTSSTVTITCTGAGSKTNSVGIYAVQAANVVASWSAASNYSTSLAFPYTDLAWSANSTGNVIASQSGYGWPVYSSGSKGSTTYASALTKTLTSSQSWLSVPTTTTNNSATVTATTANSGESNRNATVTCAWRFGGTSGAICSTASTVVTQKYPSVTVTVSSSTFNSNATFYGDVLSENSSPYRVLASDFSINQSEDFAVPTSGWTAHLFASGSLYVYNQTLTRAPSMLLKKNGTVVVNAVQAQDWASTNATWFGDSVTVTVNPGDVFVAFISL